MSRIIVDAEIDVEDVLSAASDKELLREVRRRKLDDGSLAGDRREDLVRALGRQDWTEVDYLLRTYFLRNEMRCCPAARSPEARAH